MPLVLGYGGYRIIQGDSGVTIGVLIAFLAYIRDFFRPLDDLSEKSNVLQSAMASSERVFGLLDTPEEITDPPAPVLVGAFRGDVEFDRVWFAYDKEDWVLREVSLRISAGESVAIVGATGAGKSSVISLIARFYDIQKGAVLGSTVETCAIIAKRVAPADRNRFAGSIHLFRHHRGQHRAEQSRRDACGNCRGGEIRECAQVYRSEARRIRWPGHGARRGTVHRSEATARAGPGHRAEP